MPEGMCVCVPCGKIRQQMSSLMKYFNVKVKAKDIFSRCQVISQLHNISFDLMYPLIVRRLYRRLYAS